MSYLRQLITRFATLMAHKDTCSGVTGGGCQATKPSAASEKSMVSASTHDSQPPLFSERLWSLTFVLACLSISASSIDLLCESARHLFSIQMNSDPISASQVSDLATSTTSLAKAAMSMAVLWFVCRVEREDLRPSTPSISQP